MVRHDVQKTTNGIITFYDSKELVLKFRHRAFHNHLWSKFVARLSMNGIVKFQRKKPIELFGNNRAYNSIIKDSETIMIEA